MYMDFPSPSHQHGYSSIRKMRGHHTTRRAVSQQRMTFKEQLLMMFTILTILTIIVLVVSLMTIAYGDRDARVRTRTRGMHRRRYVFSQGRKGLS